MQLSGGPFGVKAEEFCPAGRLCSGHNESFVNSVLTNGPVLSRSRYTVGVDSVVGETLNHHNAVRGMRVQAHRSQTLVVHPELDPAMLAFVKCHITSFVKWDVLRSLSGHVGFWNEPVALARELNRPIEKVQEALDELCAEEIVEVVGPRSERVYRLREGEPTTVVVNRLMARATRSQELRRIVVAHILQLAVA